MVEEGISERGEERSGERDFRRVEASGGEVVSGVEEASGVGFGEDFGVAGSWRVFRFLEKICFFFCFLRDT